MQLAGQVAMFYVVKVGDGYIVWEMTPKQMFERTKADPTLNARLDREPFATRAEAERRRIQLISAS